MGNLKDYLTGIGIGAGTLVYNFLVSNTISYYFVKNEISKAEKERKEYAISYCKGLLENQTKFPLNLFFHSGQDLARDYLIKNLDNNKQNENH